MAEYLTPTAIAAELSVSAELVRAWIRSGELRALNIAADALRRRWKIARPDLEKFLAGRDTQQHRRRRQGPRRRADPAARQVAGELRKSTKKKGKRT